MALAAKALKWGARYLRWKEPYRKASQEAADQYVGKAAKIQTLTDLVFVRDLQELADADREGVETLKAKRGFSPKSSGGFMGIGGKGGGDKDTFACDEMTINAGRSGLWEFIIVLLLCALLFWFFGDRLKQAAGVTPTPAPAVDIKVPDTSYDVLFYQKNADGSVTPINVPRLPTELRGNVKP